MDCALEDIISDEVTECNINRFQVKPLKNEQDIVDELECSGQIESILSSPVEGSLFAVDNSSKVPEVEELTDELEGFDQEAALQRQANLITSRDETETLSKLLRNKNVIEDINQIEDAEFISSKTLHGDDSVLAMDSALEDLIFDEGTECNIYKFQVKLLQNEQGIGDELESSRQIERILSSLEEGSLFAVDNSSKVPKVKELTDELECFDQEAVLQSQANLTTSSSKTEKLSKLFQNENVIEDISQFEDEEFISSKTLQGDNSVLAMDSALEDLIFDEGTECYINKFQVKPLKNEQDIVDELECSRQIESIFSSPEEGPLFAVDNSFKVPEVEELTDELEGFDQEAALQRQANLITSRGEIETLSKLLQNENVIEDLGQFEDGEIVNSKTLQEDNLILAMDCAIEDIIPDEVTECNINKFQVKPLNKEQDIGDELECSRQTERILSLREEGQLFSVDNSSNVPEVKEINDEMESIDQGAVLQIQANLITSRGETETLSTVFQNENVIEDISLIEDEEFISSKTLQGNNSVLAMDSALEDLIFDEGTECYINKFQVKLLKNEQGIVDELECSRQIESILSSPEERPLFEVDNSFKVPEVEELTDELEGFDQEAVLQRQANLITSRSETETSTLFQNENVIEDISHIEEEVFISSKTLQGDNSVLAMDSALEDLITDEVSDHPIDEFQDRQIKSEQDIGDELEYSRQVKSILLPYEEKPVSLKKVVDTKDVVLEQDASAVLSADKTFTTQVELLMDNTVFTEDFGDGRWVVNENSDQLMSKSVFSVEDVKVTNEKLEDILKLHESTKEENNAGSDLKNVFKPTDVLNGKDVLTSSEELVNENLDSDPNAQLNTKLPINKWGTLLSTTMSNSEEHEWGEFDVEFKTEHISIIDLEIAKCKEIRSNSTFSKMSTLKHQNEIFEPVYCSKIISAKSVEKEFQRSKSMESIKTNILGTSDDGCDKYICQQTSIENLPLVFLHKNKINVGPSKSMETLLLSNDLLEKKDDLLQREVQFDTNASIMINDDSSNFIKVEKEANLIGVAQKSTTLISSNQSTVKPIPQPQKKHASLSEHSSRVKANDPTTSITKETRKLGVPLIVKQSSESILVNKNENSMVYQRNQPSAKLQDISTLEFIDKFYSIKSHDVSRLEFLETVTPIDKKPIPHVRTESFSKLKKLWSSIDCDKVSSKADHNIDKSEIQGKSDYNSVRKFFSTYKESVIPDSSIDIHPLRKINLKTIIEKVTQQPDCGQIKKLKPDIQGIANYDSMRVFFNNYKENVIPDDLELSPLKCKKWQGINAHSQEESAISHTKKNILLFQNFGQTIDIPESKVFGLSDLEFRDFSTIPKNICNIINQLQKTKAEGLIQQCTKSSNDHVLCEPEITKSTLTNDLPSLEFINDKSMKNSKEVSSEISKKMNSLMMSNQMKKQDKESNRLSLISTATSSDLKTDDYDGQLLNEDAQTFTLEHSESLPIKEIEIQPQISESKSLKTSENKFKQLSHNEIDLLQELDMTLGANRNYVYSSDPMSSRILSKNDDLKYLNLESSFAIQPSVQVKGTSKVAPENTTDVHQTILDFKCEVLNHEADLPNPLTRYMNTSNCQNERGNDTDLKVKNLQTLHWDAETVRFIENSDLSANKNTFTEHGNKLDILHEQNKVPVRKIDQLESVAREKQNADCKTLKSYETAKEHDTETYKIKEEFRTQISLWDAETSSCLDGSEESLRKIFPETEYKLTPPEDENVETVSTNDNYENPAKVAVSGIRLSDNMCGFSDLESINISTKVKDPSSSSRNDIQDVDARFLIESNELSYEISLNKNDNMSMEDNAQFILTKESSESISKVTAKSIFAPDVADNNISLVEQENITLMHGKDLQSKIWDPEIKQFITRENIASRVGVEVTISLMEQENITLMQGKDLQSKIWDPEIKQFITRENIAVGIDVEDNNISLMEKENITLMHGKDLQSKIWDPEIKQFISQENKAVGIYGDDNISIMEQENITLMQGKDLQSKICDPEMKQFITRENIAIGIDVEDNNFSLMEKENITLMQGKDLQSKIWDPEIKQFITQENIASRVGVEVNNISLMEQENITLTQGKDLQSKIWDPEIKQFITQENISIGIGVEDNNISLMEQENLILMQGKDLRSKIWDPEIKQFITQEGKLFSFSGVSEENVKHCNNKPRNKNLNANETKIGFALLEPTDSDYNTVERSQSCTQTTNALGEIVADNEIKLHYQEQHNTIENVPTENLKSFETDINVKQCSDPAFGEFTEISDTNFREYFFEKDSEQSRRVGSKLYVIECNQNSQAILPTNALECINNLETMLSSGCDTLIDQNQTRLISQDDKGIGNYTYESLSQSSSKTIIIDKKLNFQKHRKFISASLEEISSDLSTKSRQIYDTVYNKKCLSLTNLRSEVIKSTLNENTDQRMLLSYTFQPTSDSLALSRSTNFGAKIIKRNFESPKPDYYKNKIVKDDRDSDYLEIMSDASARYVDENSKTLLMCMNGNSNTTHRTKTPVICKLTNKLDEANHAFISLSGAYGKVSNSIENLIQISAKEGDRKIESNETADALSRNSSTKSSIERLCSRGTTTKSSLAYDTLERIDRLADIVTEAERLLKMIAESASSDRQEEVANVEPWSDLKLSTQNKGLNLKNVPDYLLKRDRKTNSSLELNKCSKNIEDTATASSSKTLAKSNVSHQLDILKKERKRVNRLLKNCNIATSVSDSDSSDYYEIKPSSISGNLRSCSKSEESRLDENDSTFHKQNIRSRYSIHDGHMDGEPSSDVSSHEKSLNSSHNEYLKPIAKQLEQSSASMERDAVKGNASSTIHTNKFTYSQEHMLQINDNKNHVKSLPIRTCSLHDYLPPSWLLSTLPYSDYGRKSCCCVPVVQEAHHAYCATPILSPRPKERPTCHSVKCFANTACHHDNPCRKNPEKSLYSSKTKSRQMRAYILNSNSSSSFSSPPENIDNMIKTRYAPLRRVQYSS